MNLCALHMCSTHGRLEEGNECLRPGITGSYELTHGFWEPNSHHLQEQPELLTFAPSLQRPGIFKILRKSPDSI